MIDRDGKEQIALSGGPKDGETVAVTPGTMAIEVQGISVDHWPVGAKDEDLPPPILTRHVYKREGDKMVYAGRIE